MKLKMLSVLCAATLLLACRPQAISYTYQPIDCQQWQRTDTLRFDLPCLPDTQECLVSLGVRCTNQLAYQDLWVVVEQRTDTVARDTVHLLLTDLEGNWLTSGSILHEAEHPVRRLRIGMPNAQLLVYHAMQPFAVAGVAEVGIKIEPRSALLPVAPRINAQ